MPFNFKIRKRTRQYSVLSKNCFLVRVQLLDNNLMECTRPVESTGQECLDMVAQKLQLTETMKTILDCPYTNTGNLQIILL
ncbi:tyrosine-protein phosphatase non-receptor type 14-like isoform X2 [Arapaima gigas]